MIYYLTRHLGARRDSALPATDEHHAIKKIGRTLVVSIVVLIIACLVMLVSGNLVRQIYERDTTAAEHARAANAIDLLVSQTGPLTPSDAEVIGRVAGLIDARLSATAPTDATARMIPLFEGQSASGGYLVWDEGPFSGQMYRLFAPIRLPTVAAVLMIVIALMFNVRKQVADIERQRLLAYRQSRIDVVTGLANRLAFEDAIDNLKAAGVPFAVVCFDLDHFKAVNDAHGHAAGDAVLRSVARRLTELLGRGDLLARLGGDEFAMLRVSNHGTGALTMLAQACILSVEQPIELVEGTVHVGISLGIAAGGSGDLPASTLLGAADAALYRAKSATGSSFQFAGEQPNGPTDWQLRCA